MPPPISGRGPIFGSRTVEALVAAMTIEIVIGTNAKPAWIGEKPRFSCR